MRERALLVLLVTILLFAGCLGDHGGAGKDAARRFAREPIPRSDDPTRSFHVHDYWGGTTQAPLLDRNVSGGGSGSRISWGFSATPGQRVFAGTAEMRVNVTYEISGTSGAPEIKFRYQPPNAEEYIEVNVTSGKEFAIIVEPQSADPPHTYRSSWRFGLGAVLPQGGTVQLEANVRALIIRGADAIPADPPHPDRWLGQNVLTLHDGEGVLNQVVLATPAAINFGQPPNNPKPMKAVPEFTNAVTATLYYNSTTPPALHYDPRMSVAAANGDVLGLEMAPTEQNVAAAGFYRWVVTPNATHTDSPYIDESQWVFGFRWSAPLASGVAGALLVKPHAMQGEYHFVIEASRT